MARLCQNLRTREVVTKSDEMRRLVQAQIRWRKFNYGLQGWMRGYRRGRKSVKQEKITAVNLNEMKNHGNPSNKAKKVVREEKG